MEGSECNPESLKWANEQIIAKNDNLSDIKLRFQDNPDHVLDGALNTTKDNFDFSMCNPPFFGSREERNQRKSTT